jgi:hypothetical protein
MMNAAMMNNKQFCLSFIIHLAAFSIAFILSILSILLKSVPALYF